MAIKESTRSILETAGIMLAVIIFFGIVNVALYKAPEERLAEDKALAGIPISASIICIDRGWFYSATHLAIVVESHGERVVCQTGNYGRMIWKEKNITEARKKILSEINDGDNEPIILKGRYHKGKFEFRSVSNDEFTVMAEID